MVSQISSKTLAIAILLCRIAFSNQNVGSPVRIETPADGLTLGSSRNEVASTAPFSGIHWNPASLASATTTQFQFSFGGIRPITESSVTPNRSNSEQSTTIGISQAAVAIPIELFCPREAVAAFAYQKPISMNQQLNYSGNYTIDGNTYDYTNRYLASGSLDFWTAALALRLSQTVSTGASFSLVTGKGFEELQFTTQDVTQSYHIASEREYVGYDLRWGLLLSSPQGVSIGMRVEFPTVLAFVEDGTQTVANRSDIYTLNGTLERYFTGALGFSIEQPGFKIMSELNGHAPNPRLSFSDSPDYWKLGAGGAVEITAIPELLNIRFGYKWEEFDPQPYTVRYDEEVIENPSPTTRSHEGDQTLSIGGSVAVGAGSSLDFGFAQTYSTRSTNNRLFEKNRIQQGTVSVSFLF